MILRVSFSILVLSALLSSAAYAYDDGVIHPYYHPLVLELSQDGFDLEYLSGLLSDPRAGIVPAAMTISLNLKEVSKRYAPFLSREGILLAKRFLRQNLNVLTKAEKKFHVEKEVIVAILFVETRFGENKGRYRVLPTLASIAVMDSPENLQANYMTLRELDPEVSYAWMEGLARRKADWAYGELKCFLDIVRDEEIDPLEVYGSRSGALGMAQFVPSSYLTYALKKESFQRWLLSKEGAILSIANYLRSHGWKRNLPTEKKKRVLWAYNRSEPYVETVLQVAEKIGPNRGRNRPSKN
jgi:membrane-bound lytic murein transglycosylase B